MPSSEKLFFQDEFIEFYYSKSAKVRCDGNNYSILYEDIKAEIRFNLKEYSNIDRDIYRFESIIDVHKKKGAKIDVNLINDKLNLMYGIICFLNGNKIASPCEFYITDSTNYFIQGGILFETFVSQEIQIEKEIMLNEILDFINSINWNQSN